MDMHISKGIYENVSDYVSVSRIDGDCERGLI